MSEAHYTYILASKKRGALFVGVTDDLVSRVLDHKCNLVDGITAHYSIHRLVYYECHQNVELARSRENSIRELHRIFKLDLIECENPDCQSDAFRPFGWK